MMPWNEDAPPYEQIDRENRKNTLLQPAVAGGTY